MATTSCLDPCYEAKKVGALAFSNGELRRCVAGKDHCACNGARQCGASGYCVGSSGICGGSPESELFLAPVAPVAREGATSTGSANYARATSTGPPTRATDIFLTQQQQAASEISTTKLGVSSSSIRVYDHELGKLESANVDPDEQSSNSIEDFSVPKLVGLLTGVCVLALCMACCYICCFKWRASQQNKRRVRPQDPPDHTLEIQEKRLPTLMCPRDQQVLSGLKVQSSKICGATNESGQKAAWTKPALPPVVVTAPVKPQTAPPPLLV